MNDKENGLNNGYNDNGKPDILTFVQTGHFNFRLTRHSQPLAWAGNEGYS